jgi:hypothetical protein
MRLMKGSLAGLTLAGILALAPTTGFARGGGGGHGGGGHFGGGGNHFGGAGGHFAHGGSHFAGFTGHGFAGHNFAEHQGDHFARNGDRFGHEDRFRDEDHFRLRNHFGGDFFVGDPYILDSYAYDYPYYGFDYPDYGYDNNSAGDYYDNSGGDYSDDQSSPAEVTLSRNKIVAVQQLLYQLGYYQGPIDGRIGPQTAKAVRWFQSVDTLSVTGQIDGPTLKALGVS